MFWKLFPKGAYLRKNPKVLQDSINEVLMLAVQGKIHPHISRVFPLTEVKTSNSIIFIHTYLNF